MQYVLVVHEGSTIEEEPREFPSLEDAWGYLLTRFPNACIGGQGWIGFDQYDETSGSIGCYPSEAAMLQEDLNARFAPGLPEDPMHATRTAHENELKTCAVIYGPAREMQGARIRGNQIELFNGNTPYSED